MRQRVTGILLALALIVTAGCLAGTDERPPCRNEHPAGADCSYAIHGVIATARYDETFVHERAAAGAAAAGFNVTRADERGLAAYDAEGMSLHVGKREGSFWAMLETASAQPVGGLTLQEAEAEGEARCAAGIGDRMREALADFERVTEWRSASWEPCHAQISVA